MGVFVYMYTLILSVVTGDNQGFVIVFCKGSQVLKPVSIFH